MLKRAGDSFALYKIDFCPQIVSVSTLPVIYLGVFLLLVFSLTLPSLFFFLCGCVGELMASLYSKDILVSVCLKSVQLTILMLLPIFDPSIF